MIWLWLFRILCDTTLSVPLLSGRFWSISTRTSSHQNKFFPTEVHLLQGDPFQHPWPLAPRHTNSFFTHSTASEYFVYPLHYWTLLCLHLTQQQNSNCCIIFSLSKCLPISNIFRNINNYKIHKIYNNNTWSVMASNIGYCNTCTCKPVALFIRMIVTV